MTHLSPSPIFPSRGSFLDFTNPRLSRRVLQRVVERALAHSADYQSLPAHLQCDIALLAAQAGMSCAALKLQAACTDPARLLCDAMSSQGLAPKSLNPEGSAGIPGAHQASFFENLRYPRRVRSLRVTFSTLRHRLALAFLCLLFRGDMGDAQAVDVSLFKSASAYSDDLVTQIRPGFRIDPNDIFQTNRLTHTGQRLIS
mgnify:CR=1 FL=1